MPDDGWSTIRLLGRREPPRREGDALLVDLTPDPEGLIAYLGGPFNSGDDGEGEWAVRVLAETYGLKTCIAYGILSGELKRERDGRDVVVHLDPRGKVFKGAR